MPDTYCLISLLNDDLMLLKNSFQRKAIHFRAYIVERICNCMWSQRPLSTRMSVSMFCSFSVGTFQSWQNTLRQSLLRICSFGLHEHMHSRALSPHIVAIRRGRHQLISCSGSRSRLQFCSASWDVAYCMIGQLRKREQSVKRKEENCDRARKKIGVDASNKPPCK